MCAVNSCSRGVFNVSEHDIQQAQYFMRFFILLFYLTCVPVQLNFCQSKPQILWEKNPHGSKKEDNVTAEQGSWHVQDIP